MSSELLLALVVITALAFDFTNGFHDTGNAMATSIASGALPPKVAVALSGLLNLVGAFLSFSVAATIASGLVSTDRVTLTVVFAGLVGGITWNLLTWYLGVPSSSSHALIGGVGCAAIPPAADSGVQWHGVVSKVVLPAMLSPVIAGLVAAAGTMLVQRISSGVSDRVRMPGFRMGQIGSASLMSLAHGTNDAQKTMGVITLALIAHGSIASGTGAPAWVVVSCAVPTSRATSLGGWRIIRPPGRGLVEIKPPQGMAAEAASTATILFSAHVGYSLSTTHVATGSILGTGIGRRLLPDGAGTEVRWAVAGRMALAWAVTLPAAGLVGATAMGVALLLGDGTPAVLLLFAALVAGSVGLYLLSRRAPVTP